MRFVEVDTSIIHINFALRKHGFDVPFRDDVIDVVGCLIGALRSVASGDAFAPLEHDLTDTLIAEQKYWTFK